MPDGVGGHGTRIRGTFTRDPQGRTGSGGKLVGQLYEQHAPLSTVCGMPVPCRTASVACWPSAWCRPGAAVLAGAAATVATTVTIYSGRTEDLIGPLLERFAEETGIDIDVRYGDSADLALLIDEEGDKSPADVFLSQSPGAVGFLDPKGRLGDLPDDVLDLVARAIRADDGTGSASRAGCGCSSTTPTPSTEGDLPATVLDLAHAGVEGPPRRRPVERLVPGLRHRDARSSSATTRRSSGSTGIAANDARRTPNNIAIVEAVDRGEIDVGLVNHYYNYQARPRIPTTRARNHFFAPDDLGSLLIVTAACGRRGHGDQDEAARSSCGSCSRRRPQRYFAEETFEYPLAAGVSRSRACRRSTIIRRRGHRLRPARRRPRGDARD